LELWLASIQNSNGCNQILLELFPAGVSLLEYGSDTLKKVLHILESYVLMDPLTVLQMHANALVASLTKLMGDLNANAVSVFLRFIDVLNQSCQNAGCFMDLLQVMVNQGLFAKAMNNVLVGEDLSTIVIGYIMYLSRVMVYQPHTTVEIMQSGGNNILDSILKVFFRRFDSMGHLKQRKLCSLAITSIIGTGNPVVMTHLGEILSIFTSVAIQVFDSKTSE
jgi:hypothetical protein